MVANSINTLLVPVFNIVVSSLVVRLASVELWGEFVRLLIGVQLAVHVIGWGNKEYLLRAFSRQPAQAGRTWQTTLLTRLTLFAIYGVVVGLVTDPPGRAIWLILWCLGLALCQAQEVLVVYRRAFAIAALVEVASLGIMAAVIGQWGGRITVDDLITLFTSVNLIKAAVFLWLFRSITLRGFFLNRQLNLGYFGQAFPFFLLGLSGMLQSRMDLYAANFFLPEREVGQYQILSNLLLYLQALANFILLPFVKSLYRLGYQTIFKIAGRLLILGVILIFPSLALVHLALTYLYEFDLPWYFLAAGGLLILPIYGYLPLIYAHYKADLQATVIKINLAGMALNLLLSLLLLPRLGMIGAVLSGATAQWLMLFAYIIQSRNHAFSVSQLS